MLPPIGKDIMTAPSFRSARRNDCRHIASLFLISSDGLAAYIWSRMQAFSHSAGLDASPIGEQSLIDIGEQRCAREGVAFSYQNCLIAERAGAVIGMLHSFPMDEPPAPSQAESDPVLRPYAELEDYGSLYISGVAVYPEYRRQGVGSRLLALAEDRARASALPRLSLICFERNVGAMRLYARSGYSEIARRPVVPHPSLHYPDGDAILLAKPLP
jgi:ribosomal protein S18 acetylase RimI-like enzyme